MDNIYTFKKKPLFWLFYHNEKQIGSTAVHKK